MSEIQGAGKAISPKNPDKGPQAPKASGHREIQQAVDRAWAAKDFAGAHSLAADSHAFQKDPKDFCMKLHSFLQQTGQMINKEKNIQKGPLLFTVEKIKEQKEENPYRFAVMAVKSALILRKAALGQQKNVRGKWASIQELAISSLPDSMNYVLQTAWATLFEKDTSIVIAGVHFLKDSLEALLSALRKKDRLFCVSFNACMVDEKLFGAPELENLCTSLRYNADVRHLSFRHHCLEGNFDGELTSLSNEILSLDLSHNGITQCQFLKQNWPKLRELNLEHNQISDKDADQLLKILENNKNLRQLKLWGNKIGPKTAKSLVSCKHNLDCLDLGGNPLENESFDDPRVYS